MSKAQYIGTAIINAHLKYIESGKWSSQTINVAQKMITSGTRDKEVHWPQYHHFKPPSAKASRLAGIVDHPNLTPVKPT
jgi:hypothetical protein